MRRAAIHLRFVSLLAVLVGGCRLPGHPGPIPPSQADCRQLAQQGIAALERGQVEQAEALLSGAVEACEGDPQARRYYAEALWQRSARHEAIVQMKEAIRLGGEDAMGRVRLAEMQLAVGQVPRARRSAERALDVDPKLAAAWAVRGRVMQAEGRTRQALADFHRALGYTPNSRPILLEVAELYRQLNEPQRALAALHSLTDTYAPGEEPQQVLYLTGLAHLALQRYEDAATSLSAAARRETPTPEIYYSWGEAELLAGRPAAAALAVRNALTLSPAHRPSRELLRRIEVARQPQGERPR